MLDALGFRRIINAAGHYTIFGGSNPSPKVTEAMDKAAKFWIDMRELQVNSGKQLAELLGSEDGIVTSGAYAALILASAASHAVMQEHRATKIHEPKVIIQASHVTDYAEAYKVPGLQLKRVRRKSQSDLLENEVDQSTVALVYVVNESELEFTLAETVSVGNKLEIPVIVDAAVVDPPIRAVRKILECRPDAVAVSGGKGFNGPNDTGILIGKKILISRARDLGFPNYGVGRGMKVSKEQVAGLLTAIQLAAGTNEEALVVEWERRIKMLMDLLGSLPEAAVQIVFPWALNISQPVPRLVITFSHPRGREIAEAVRRRLFSGPLPILTRLTQDNTVRMDLRVIESDDDIELIASRTKAEINSVLREVG
jgi:L-seryl-tRNA(Ser) seleniumtransferase